MIGTWKTLSREQRRVWSVIGGAILAASAFKVAYFKFSRKLIVDDSQRRHQEGLERLKEAKEFAAWSKADREARLPPLTPAQREQMREYLKIVEQHGVTRTSMTSSSEECEGCPIMRHGKTLWTPDAA